jgi:hypothetical protein
MMPVGQNLLDKVRAGRLLSGGAGILKSPNTPEKSQVLNLNNSTQKKRPKRAMLWAIVK